MNLVRIFYYETQKCIITKVNLILVNCDKNSWSRFGCLFEIIFGSSQGLIVAAVYCLFNEDVQQVLKTKLARKRLHKQVIKLLISNISLFLGHFGSKCSYKKLDEAISNWNTDHSAVNPRP